MQLVLIRDIRSFLKVFVLRQLYIYCPTKFTWYLYFLSYIFYILIRCFTYMSQRVASESDFVFGVILSIDTMRLSSKVMFVRTLFALLSTQVKRTRKRKNT